MKIIGLLSLLTVSVFACDLTKIKDGMASCDSLGSADAKCNDRACHKALHYLVDEDTIKCYVSLGLGPASDLNKYVDLDKYCHDE
ncbi:hypothetical protein DYB37_010583, partial [Aphanomyces astaci]